MQATKQDIRYRLKSCYTPRKMYTNHALTLFRSCFATTRRVKRTVCVFQIKYVCLYKGGIHKINKSQSVCVCMQARYCVHQKKKRAALYVSAIYKNKTWPKKASLWSFHRCLSFYSIEKVVCQNGFHWSSQQLQKRTTTTALRRLYYFYIVVWQVPYCCIDQVIGCSTATEIAPIGHDYNHRVDLGQDQYPLATITIKRKRSFEFWYG
mmetsp:Transcript_27390/g.42101  ORF Transcript_27390/g.42101 Transcript_27390/m.42101 type:complete len:208 (-) Transcript_27390:149-772(-)